MELSISKSITMKEVKDRYVRGLSSFFREKYLFLTLVAVVGIVVLAYQPQAAAGVIVDVTERPLYTIEGNQSEPRISGDRVIFTNLGTFFADIFVVNVLTGVFDNVTNTPDRNEQLNDIDGDLVVYSDFDESSIVVIDVSSSPPLRLFTISGTGTRPAVRPRIQGDYIVYERFNGNDYDIWVKEVGGNGGDWPMTIDQVSNDQDPSVSGDKMVYTKDYNSVWWCYIENPPTDPPNCTLIGEGQDPDIDGNRVVYSKEVEDGNYDVFLYTIGGPDLPINLTKRAGNQVRPTISGNYIAYDDDSAGNWDIYLYLIDEALTTQLTSNTADQKLAHVGDGHVVYEDSRNLGTTGIDIYVTDFTVRSGELYCEPSAVDFGDVTVGESSDQIVTCTDTLGGNWLDRTVVNDSSGFSATTEIELPHQFSQNETVDIAVSFMPSGEAWYSDYMVINGHVVLPAGHTAYWYELVALEGTGVLVELPPVERIQSILEFFDANWESGELIGDGPGNSADNRAHALRNMIESAGDLLANGYTAAACEQLMDAYRRTDGAKPPPDFVAGDAAVGLANLIYELWTDLGCSP